MSLSTLRLSASPLAQATNEHDTAGSKLENMMISCLLLNKTK